MNEIITQKKHETTMGLKQSMKKKQHIFSINKSIISSQ